jgi:hypothetical protein
MKGPALLAVILIVIGVGLLYIGWTAQSAALLSAAKG